MPVETVPQLMLLTTVLLHSVLVLSTTDDNCLCICLWKFVLSTRQFAISDITYVCGYNGGGPTVK